jgi:hypothetical protein
MYTVVSIIDNCVMHGTALVRIDEDESSSSKNHKKNPASGAPLTKQHRGMLIMPLSMILLWDATDVVESVGAQATVDKSSQSTPVNNPPAASKSEKNARKNQKRKLKKAGDKEYDGDTKESNAMIEGDDDDDREEEEDEERSQEEQDIGLIIFKAFTLNAQDAKPFLTDGHYNFTGLSCNAAQMVALIPISLIPKRMFETLQEASWYGPETQTETEARLMLLKRVMVRKYSLVLLRCLVCLHHIS